MSHPLRTPAELEQLRHRTTDPRFAASWRQVRTAAEEAAAADLQPLPVGAGWGHHYNCPRHSVPLRFDPDQPHRHVCPIGEHVVSGPDTDGGWLTVRNGRILAGMTASALAWRACGDEALLDYPRRVVLGWAELYPELPPQGTLQGQGKVEGISLAEATWLMGLSETVADLADGLSEAEQSAATGLIAQAAEFVHGQLMRKIHNIECWHLAALAVAGSVLGDRSLVDDVVSAEYGLARQLQVGIRDDGWWAEGSPTYHFYMAQPLLTAARALRGTHPEISDSPRLRGMSAAPLGLLRDDLSIPAFNDGWFDIALPGGLARAGDHYEKAWGLWHQPAEAAALHALARAGKRRIGPAAFAFGPDLASVDDPGLPPVRPVHPASGYAVLADSFDSERRRFGVVKFGPHGGGHGHPDKLQLDLNVAGVRVAPDLGSPAYNSPLQGPWIRQTLSHNTATLAGQSQPPQSGRLLGRIERDGWTVVDAEVSWPDGPEQAADSGAWLKEPRVDFLPAYAGATMRRTVLAADERRGYLIDLFGVSQRGDERVDLAWRQPGAWTGEPAPNPDATDWTPLPGTQAEHLDLVGGLPQQWRITWEHEGVRTACWGFGAPGTTAALASCPGVSVEEAPHHVVLRGSSARETWFLTVLDVGPEGSSGVDTVDVEAVAGGVRIDVTTPHGTDHVVVTGGEQTEPGLAVDGDAIRLTLGGDLPAHLDTLAG